MIKKILHNFMKIKKKTFMICWSKEKKIMICWSEEDKEYMRPSLLPTQLGKDPFKKFHITYL